MRKFSGVRYICGVLSVACAMAGMMLIMLNDGSAQKKEEGSSYGTMYSRLGF